jgi:cell division protein FtsW
VNKAAIMLLTIMLVLLTIGVVMLFSTSAAYAKDRYGDQHYVLKRQLAWMLVGAVGCVMAASVPYPKLRGVCTGVLVAAGIMLALVLVPHIGLRVGGARRWLGFGPLRYQPSELGKLALVVWLAHWLAKEKRRLDRFSRGFAIPIGVTGMTLLLILAEPDFGSTALMAAVSFAMMYIAGVRLRFIVPAILVGLAGFAMLIIHNPTRAARLMAFMDLEKYKQGAGYQDWQAILAFGSGGIRGLGLGNSFQKMFYLPEAHTDFIFPIIGEELGLVGTMAILLAFVLLMVCAAIISLRASDLFGQYLGMGMAVLLAMQALINIGVVTAWLPTKGLPLPFISFGGSNLVVNMAAIGLLLNIYRFSSAEAESEEQEFFARRSSLT